MSEEKVSETNKTTDEIKKCEIFACGNTDLITECNQCSNHICGKCIINMTSYCRKVGLFFSCPYCKKDIFLTNNRMKMIMVLNKINFIYIKNCCGPSTYTF